MDIKKFNQKMAKPKYAKGGYIKKLGNRQYFATGGIPTNVTPSAVGGPGNVTNTGGTGIQGITNALGLNAQSANIQNGTNAEQINNAYTGANNAINAQVGLTNTLAPQATQAVGNQGELANQELEMTRGGGPNPALNQLNQATGKNVANQAALLAGQRGASSNPALAARTAAMAGSNAQQGAAGQAATLEAQQQIAAQQNLANLSNQQVGQAQGATTALNSAQQNEQNILQGANTASNNAAVAQQSNINNINAQMNGKVLGGITSGVSALSGGMFAEGGEVHPEKKHKLEFIHKMTKMGLDHFDKGTPSGPITAHAPEAQDSFRKAFHASPPSAGDAPASASDNQPQASPSPTPHSNWSESDRVKAAADRNKQLYGDYAEGGEISANPLVQGITTAPMQMPQAPGYNQVQTPSAPQVEATPQIFQDSDKKPKSDKKEDPMAGATNAISGGGMSAGLGDALSAAGPMALAAAHGGEIWDMKPHEHAAFADNHFKQYFAKGGESKDVPAMVSPGEVYLDPEAVDRVKHGADPLKEGMKVPGKAKVKGDSYKNDTIPATLKEGGVVIDRKHVGHPDKARLFVLKSLKATGKHLKKPAGMK